MTLIEVVIALALLMITSTALIETTMLALNTNFINALRDEAVSVAEQRIGDLRNAPFTSAVTDPLLVQTDASGVPDTPATITRTVRNIPISFTVTRTIRDINTNSKQVTLKIDWIHKGNVKTHQVTTIVSKK